MARKRSPYKSEKRQKELKRQKKKQEKILRRQGKPIPQEDEGSQP